MRTVTAIDFHATNHLGVTLRTFEEREMALAWVRDHAPEHTDLHVEEVTRIERRRRLSNLRLVSPVSTRAALLQAQEAADDFDVPPMPVGVGR